MLQTLTRIVDSEFVRLSYTEAVDLLTQAEELLTVPPAISRTLTDYTRDPHTILERRQRVGDTIERLIELLGEDER